MDNFIQRKTTLDLNGPTLSWLSQPTGVTTCGVGTFTGIATATFPVGLAASYATNTGSLSYQWWYELAGTSAPTQAKMSNGTMTAIGLTGITGAATTTLTVYGNSTTYELNGTAATVDGLKFFLKPDYVPSAYSSGGQVTVSTGRSTGNAINEGVVDSTSPWGAPGWPSLYSVDSNKVDFTLHPSIQIITQPETQTIPATNAASAQGTARFTVVGIVTGNSNIDTLSYQWQANGSDLSNGETSYTISVPVAPVNVPVPGFDGGNGGRGNHIYYNTNAWTGSRQVNFRAWEESGIWHQIRIDGIRDFPENGNWNIDVEGGRIYKCYPLSSPANLYIGGDTPAGGGNKRLIIEEGGDDWNDMLLEASQGYFAKYQSDPLVSSGPTSENRTLTDRVSGATGSILELSTATAGIQTVTCRITHPIACNSPLYSDIVNLNVITAREIIKHENMNEGLSGSWYSSGETNLADSSITIGSAAVGSKVVVIYAPEKDIVAKVTMAAAAGRTHENPPHHVGGKGGVSSFYMTLKQNVEYAVKVGSAESPQGDKGGGGEATFLYEGGTLIACVGGGGKAGDDYVGGDGGGVGVSGENGPGGGNGAGEGGERYGDGQLPLQGFFPGGTWLPSGSAYETTAGRVSACTFGQYWTAQGYSACQDMGKVKFRAGDGSVISESTDTITRGYKAGLAHRVNGGQTSNSFLGGGGSGSTGGDAANGNGAGGGGGSGYQNGDVNTVEQLFGNTSQTGYVKFEI